MNILYLNASPKPIFSASQYFLDLLRFPSNSRNANMIKLSSPAVYDEIFNHFENLDVLVLTMPVYVDGVPSNALRFLEEAEKFLKGKNYKFKIYVIANCGFYEGTQCKHLLNIMQIFCNKTGLVWGGGLGIGAGEMLSVMRLTPFLAALLSLLFTIPFIFITGLATVNAGLASVISSAVSIIVFLILSSRLFYSIRKLQKAIKRDKIISDIYTGLTLCPRIVFLMFSNMYMIIRAMLCGVGFWKLYKKS